MTRKLIAVSVAPIALAGMAQAQIPDLLTSYDAAAASMGAGGALSATGGGTAASYYNPAGLAYATSKELSFDVKNKQTSTTQSTGASTNRLITTDGNAGKRGLSHLGLAIPLSKGRGVVALTYTLGGYIEDTQTSNSLTFGGLTAQNYILTRRAAADFYSLAYAKSSPSQDFSWGLAFNYVRQTVDNTESGTLTGGGQSVPLNTNNAETGYGYGATLGIQGTPKNQPNISWGASVRTPISLKGNPDTNSIYGTIPGRIVGGLAFRQDAFRGGKDYLVYGIQGQYFYGGKDSLLFQRNNQFVTNLGLEYNLLKFGGRFPIRLGYVINPGGGDGYGSRNSLNYGVGYRPENGKFDVDLGIGNAQHGGTDFAFGVTLRFDK